MNRNILHSLLAATLILVLSVSALVLVTSAGAVYGRLEQNQDTVYDLRVAANYLTTRLRRADYEGGIAVVESPLGACLVLSETLGGEVYETRIYQAEGTLFESFVSADEDFDHASAFAVVGLDGFSPRMDGRVVTVAIVSGGEAREVAVTLTTEDFSHEK